jgi:hypothetical protein
VKKLLVVVAAVGLGLAAVGLLAPSPGSTPTRLITAAGDGPSSTTSSSTTSSTTTSTTEHPSSPPTTFVDAPHRETPHQPTTSTTQAPPAGQLVLTCASGNGGASVVCEWRGVPKDATNVVVLREVSGTPAKAIGSTGAATTRYVDDTAQPGTAYVYRVSAYRDEQFLVTSNPVRIGAPASSPSTSTTVVHREASPQQWYIAMTCQPDPVQVVVCSWAQPPVAVAEWRVVRRHAGDNEIPIPTTSERRIADPTVDPHTTYTYVLNGLDSNGRSVVLASATVTS